MAALPSQQTTRRMSQQLLSKCDPGGLARLRSKKKNKPAAALIWSMLANRLAGEMSSTLFSDAVCNCLLNNIEHDPDMTCKVFSIIALEKFSLTGPCKARIMQTSIRRLLRETANMSTYGLTDKEEIAGVLQAKFCAEWSLRNIFRDVAETENDMLARESLSPSDAGKRTVDSNSTNINVMLNTLDATRHWKISEDGLSIRNDGSTFESIRATQSVTCGKWYYEVTLVTAGIMQLGWATVHCQFSPEDGTGVGDDVFGFAYDGCRRLIWADGESEPYGDVEAWRPGDVLGFYLDIDNAQMECFINGGSLGVISPFLKDHFSIQATVGYYPAFSFTSFQQATVNFGATPFKYPPALPWRNLNEQGTITSETRSAIVRPRGDSVYGRIQLDPVTGVRLPTMPEEEGDVDYSLLCTICCDHTATVTLQPCGHDGLCVECAYSLDMCRDAITLSAASPSQPDDMAIAAAAAVAAMTVGSPNGYGFCRPVRTAKSSSTPASPVGRARDAIVCDSAIVSARAITFADVFWTDYALAVDEDEDDTNGMDVALVDEGREASGSEVMDHSAPDFPDAPSIHSRRGSVQVMPMPSLPEGVAASTTTLSMASTAASSPINATMPMIDFASMGAAPLGSNNVGNARFGGRRASMPSNRLEM
ncbi:RING finger and SPRY domain-containing protein 1 [Mortierella alpina]|uniref:RING finger and SPRY domain-containing protein 1 n=1 Tax=Mortierella alpina TaxID=64518 RepID=A0A9P6LXB2_MORAP|nr:RING finger and SPRY domain-containing protein 1 [Mortierella alpina]